MRQTTAHWHTKAIIFTTQGLQRLNPSAGRKLPRPQKTRIPLSVTLRERKVGIKLTAFLFVALIAMSALLVVLRFERIAGVQRDINEINAGIAAARRGFGELDMDLSSSIDLEAARLAAETAGLHPKK